MTGVCKSEGLRNRLASTRDSLSRLSWCPPVRERTDTAGRVRISLIYKVFIKSLNYPGTSILIVR